MPTRVIFKNPSAVSFKGNDVLGVKSFGITVDSDVDTDQADNETSAIHYGVQNQTGTAELEGGDLNDVFKAWLVGSSGSLRGSAVPKYPANGTAITIVIATAYCNGLDGTIPHGDVSTVRASFSFNPDSLSFN